MTDIVNYSDKYISEFCKLYYSAHDIPHDIDDSCEYMFKSTQNMDKVKVKLLKINNRVKGYVIFSNSFTHNDRISIEELFIDKKHDSKANYIALTESTNVSLFLKRYRYAEFYLSSQKNHSQILAKNLDLNSEKKLYGMRIDLKVYKTRRSEGSIEFINFKKGMDEEKRAFIQNSIFKDTKEHKDLSVEDIMFEEEQDFYIDDGGMFLSYNGNIVGYSQIVLEKYPFDMPYIVNFGILKDYRGLGLSRILLNHTLDIIKSKGFSEAFVTVDASNKRAYRLYKSEGFRKQSEMGCYLYKYR